MIIIGHRGARGLAPENTIASLKKALAHQVDEIEIDVRVTKDGIPILHHDRELIDPNGKRHKIENTSYGILLEHKSDLTKFTDALNLLIGTVPLNVEIKPGVNTKPIVAAIQKALDSGWKMSDFRFASFSYSVLEEIDKALPDAKLVVNETWSGVRAGHRARKLNAFRICMSTLWLWSGFIKAVSRNSYPLVTYTLNNPAKARRWAKYGLYGVVTDYPDRYQK
ncbi:MAG: glycerophosphodiester phosphodiesterase [Candidatus Saccharimonadales bacterium]